MSWLQKNWPRLVLGFLVLQFAGLGLWEAWRDSPTIDEGVYITSGVAILTEHSGQLNFEQPPLSKALAAIPTLSTHPHIAKDTAWRNGQTFDVSDHFIHKLDEHGKLRQIVFLARLVPLTIAIGIGFLIFELAQQIGDKHAGYFAVGLWFTLPIALGFGHLDTTDLPFTASILLLALAAVRFAKCPSLFNGVWLGVASGICLLTRSYGLVPVSVTGITLLVLGHKALRPTLRGLGLVAITTLAIVWLGYLVLVPADLHGEARHQANASIAIASHKSFVDHSVLSIPFPLEYRAGIAYLMNTSQPRNAYMFGQHWVGSKWWYWPGNLFTKLPATALLVLLVGTVTLCTSKLQQRQSNALLIALAVTFLLGLYLQPLNLGVRYMLPGLILLLVICATAFVSRKQTISLVGAGILVTAQAITLWMGAPNTIAQANVPFQPAFQYVSDSNVDWGQNFYELQSFAKGKHMAFGLLLTRGLGNGLSTSPHSLLGMRPSDAPEWVAVSATRLTEFNFNQLSWLRKYCPVRTIGGSILIYRFNKPPNASRGPSMPADICHQKYSTIKT